MTELWHRYRADGDLEARALLLERHLGLVRHVAAEMTRRIPAVEFGEMVSAGTLGLLRAIESFDLSRGLAFSTYAVRRIRGAILDDLRGRDTTPRSVRAKRRRLLAVREALEARLGRSATSAEMAMALGLSLEAYWRLCDAAGQASAEEMPAAPAAAADAQLDAREAVERMRANLARLPERERMVVALTYYEELSLKEIGGVLGVSESRVCQIRLRALQRLKATMAGPADRAGAA